MLIAVDVETLPIRPMPDYPPELKGVAIFEQTPWRGRYITDLNEAKKYLEKAIECQRKLVFHNGKFDLAVLEKSLGIKVPLELYEDTLILSYLADPNSESLALKDVAHKELGMKPEERDEIVDWLVAHQPIANVRLVASKANKERYAGAFVSYAPRELVAKYAIGDVERTLKLAEKFLPLIAEKGMQKAYEVEKELTYNLMRNELEGIRINLAKLEEDVTLYRELANRLEIWIRQYIGVDMDFNLNSGAVLIETLVEKGLADPNKIGLTPTGKYKSDKATISACIKDPTLGAVKEYLASLNTCLRTFMEPWLIQARATGGTIHTHWNQTRNNEAGSATGTRTGRLSSTPNFQNIPRDFPDFFKSAAWPLEGAPVRLPSCREYVLPDEGHVLINRDYSQQEVRIFAHFEDGTILQSYREDPWFDMHEFAQKAIKDTLGLDLPRKPVKILNLGLLYGMGLSLLYESLSRASSVPLLIDDVKRMKDTVLNNIPNWPAMNREMKNRAKAKMPIRTWLGRIHYCEEPKMVNGEFKTFEYKMLNTLIQGSAGDCTKVAWNRVDPAIRAIGGRPILQVHDEIMCSVPADKMHEGMKILKDCMESVEFDLPMLSEGKVGPDWGHMVEYDKKGVITYGKH